jgi:hypothetical protein
LRKRGAVIERPQEDAHVFGDLPRHPRLVEEDTRAVRSIYRAAGIRKSKRDVPAGQ